MKMSFARAQAILLAAVMAFGLFGILRTPANIAYAEELDEWYEDVDGEYLTAEEQAYYEAANSEPQAWTDPTRLPPLGGKFNLTTDVRLTKTYKVPACWVDLDLNGHTVTTEANGDTMFYVGSDAGYQVTLSIYDSSGTHGRVSGTNRYAFEVLPGCTLNLYGGTITGNSSWSGSGAWLHSGSTFNMYGGSVTDNWGQEGVVSGEGRLNLYGGSITYNGGAGVTVLDVHVSGSPVVCGNMMQIDTGMLVRDIAVDSSYFVVNVDGPLSSGAYIGVYDYNAGADHSDEVVLDEPLVVTRGLEGNGYAYNFVSNQGFIMGTSESGEAQLEQ